VLVAAKAKQQGRRFRDSDGESAFAAISLFTTAVAHLTLPSQWQLQLGNVLEDHAKLESCSQLTSPGQLANVSQTFRNSNQGEDYAILCAPKVLLTTIIL